jgi:hypothetical protein
VGGTLGSSSQAQQICVIQTGGFAQEERWTLNHPTFQVLVRSGDSSTGLEAKCDAVITALNKFDGTLSGTRYVDIQKMGDAHYLGRDEQRRPLYSLNFEAYRAA